MEIGREGIDRLKKGEINQHLVVLPTLDQAR
jgi:hypothetical protein